MLTKTDFCRAVQCIRQLWLHYNKPDEEVVSIDPMKVRYGREVGEAARHYFGCNAIVQFGTQQQMVDETQYYLNLGTKVLAEASFISNEGFCSVDILKNLGNNEVEIYEVKSSKNKDFKEIYKYDLAYQYRILTEAGYNVTKACLVCVRDGYVRVNGINYDELFDVIEMTEECKSYQNDIERILSGIGENGVGTAK